MNVEIIVIENVSMEYSVLILQTVEYVKVAILIMKSSFLED
jgi:hypothetical protein